MTDLEKQRMDAFEDHIENRDFEIYGLTETITDLRRLLSEWVVAVNADRLGFKEVDGQWMEDLLKRSESATLCPMTYLLPDTPIPKGG